ncbi:MAG: hypothetical protein Ct9H300mP14_05730 [Gammaproteobacteria bacterium]|nr:MAG: hypothetical protein Ct9H300mP14_05730 [Gammaproteobacteria bacterium]
MERVRWVQARHPNRVAQFLRAVDKKHWPGAGRFRPQLVPVFWADFVGHIGFEPPGFAGCQSSTGRYPK